MALLPLPGDRRHRWEQPPLLSEHGLGIAANGKKVFEDYYLSPLQVSFIYAYICGLIKLSGSKPLVFLSAPMNMWGRYWCFFKKHTDDGGHDIFDHPMCPRDAYEAIIFSHAGSLRSW